MDKAFIIFISEKCHSFNCPRFASCVNNKCACNRGYVMIGERCEGMDTFKIVKQDSLFWFTCILNVNFFYLSQVLSINSHYLKNDLRKIWTNWRDIYRGFIILYCLPIEWIWNYHFLKFISVKCDVSKCARNAICRNNKCQCKSGYIGNGVTKCQGTKYLFTN